MPKKLRKLKIDRVDMVNRGANPEAHILLFKRDDESDEDIDKAGMTLQEILDHDEAMQEACEDKWKILEAFQRSLQSISETEDEAERLRLTETSAAQFVRLMGPVMDTLNELEEEVHMADKTQAKAQVDKSAEETEEVMAVSHTQLQDLVNLHVEVKDLKQQLESTTALLEAMTKRAEKAETDLAKRDESTEDDIWKTATTAQRKAMEAERLEKVELLKKVAEGERYIRQRECIAKVNEFEYLPLKADDDWEVFYEIDKLDEKFANRIYQLFKAGDINLRKSGLGKERGFNGTGDGMGDTALDQIEWLANDEMAKSNGQLSYADAIGKVAKAHPALYRRYTEEIQTRPTYDRGE
jgi:hypothetical protein